MVLLRVKRELKEFVVETKTSVSVDQLCTEVGELHNLMLSAERLAGQINQLAKHGPMRKQAGCDDATGELIDPMKEKAENPHYDPLGYRIGKPPAPEAAKVLERTADECRAAVDVKQAERKIVISRSKIEEAIQNIRGAVLIAYPMNLPEYDIIRVILEGKDNIKAACPQDAVDPKDCVLWFARKKLDRKEKLSKYCGKNEKMFLKVRLQTKNQKMPQREARLDKDAQTKMMQYWHRKNEEDKRLKEEADDDDYLNSEWANPKAYKSALNGMAGLKFR
eukprot:CAMPEP_0184479054 /NCGR_PEP_ID=MMETSP0113_2-20130426/914_1 /TAXON_ID=91329 /ORGANISM="Norrisiella sphaerica, Strain BC52" /LENGTH=277 /DNA_ID=CAMNT_0026857045 /DNA_START=64 /DNA_END=897 /DNA_ORIENTATION=-